MRIPRILTAAAAAMFLRTAEASAFSAGNTTAQVLKLGSGARYAALGDTGAAIGGDASAVFWNPAGLGFSGRCSAFTGHSALFQSVNHTVLAAACPAGRLGVFALSGQFLEYGKITALDNTGAVDGAFTPSDRVYSAAWGLRLGRHLAIGGTVKRLTTKIETRTSAYAADAGAQVRYSIFSAGFAARNMGRKIRFNDVAESMPRITKFGLKADLPFVSLAADAGGSKDGSWYSGGAEYAVPPDITGAPFFLRAGYSTRLKTGGYNFMAGVGVLEKRWGFDYALVPYGDLGLTDHFSVSCAFGPAPSAGTKSREKAGSLRDNPGMQSDDLILIPSEYPSTRKKR